MIPRWIALIAIARTWRSNYRYLLLPDHRPLKLPTLAAADAALQNPERAA